MFDFDFLDLAGEDATEADEAEAPIAKGLDEPDAAAVQKPDAKAVDDPFVGSWAYMGRHGLTIYKVRKSSSGHLLFEGPDASGSVLSGVLKRHGPHVQGDLVNDRGMAVGTIRLRVPEEDHALVSTFRVLGKEAWGQDIKASRYFPAARSPVAEGPGLSWEDDAFTVHWGFLRSGGDLHAEETTVAKAKVKCGSMADCRGFCFKASPQQDADAVVRVYYKDRWDLARAAADVGDAGGWVSYRYEAAMLKLSDLPGTGIDEAIVAEVARGMFNMVYVFKSPLATFPEWKKNLKVHQIVILWHTEGAGLQLEYFVGGVHFQRKPHPWVHRKGAELVDEVVPARHPQGFSGESVSRVLRKWLEIGKAISGDTPVAKDCIIFAMEVVETVGAMTPRLMAHFQTTLGMQHEGWD